MDSSPKTVEALNDLPIKVVRGSPIYIRDVAHVRNGSPPQTNIARVDGQRARADGRDEDRQRLDPRRHRAGQGGDCST